MPIKTRVQLTYNQTIYIESVRFIKCLKMGMRDNA